MRIALFAVIFAANLVLARAEDEKKQIAALASPEIIVRRAAVDAIQTLDDPAIPPACLPLLKDEGFSIRRQAARAIGSRFLDIPAGQRKTYVEALKQCAAEGPEDVTLLCQRAIGLLTSDYQFPSFSVGPKGRFVLYERRRLPVLASVKEGPHSLLSPVAHYPDGPPDLLTLAVTSQSAEELFAPKWHPGGSALAFTMILQRRFFHPICIWVAGDEEIKVLEPRSLKYLLPERYPDWGTTSEFVRWDGDKAIVRIFDCADPNNDDPPNDPGVLISYDIRTKETARAAH